jgi:hypothetical protein
MIPANIFLRGLEVEFTYMMSENVHGEKFVYRIASEFVYNSAIIIIFSFSPRLPAL